MLKEGQGRFNLNLSPQAIFKSCIKFLSCLVEWNSSIIERKIEMSCGRLKRINLPAPTGPAEVTSSKAKLCNW